MEDFCDANVFASGKLGVVIRMQKQKQNLK